MCAKSRKSIRYEILGRIESEELSAFPGKIIDISSQGCKIHYSNPVTVSLETEYTVRIKFSDNNLPENITMICQPVWASEDSGSTDIGMKFLHSPDTDTLQKYIAILHRDAQDSNSIENQIVENECQFI